MIIMHTPGAFCKRKTKIKLGRRVFLRGSPVSYIPVLSYASSRTSFSAVFCGASIRFFNTDLNGKPEAILMWH